MLQPHTTHTKVPKHKTFPSSSSSSLSNPLNPLPSFPDIFYVPFNAIMSKGSLQFEIIGTSLAVTVVWLWASFEHKQKNI